jgi:hypothetical protein
MDDNHPPVFAGIIVVSAIATIIAIGCALVFAFAMAGRGAL